MAQEIVRLEDVNREIAAARTIAEIKDAYDKIEALKRYTRSRAPKDLEAQNDIAAAGIWAAWKGGRLLRQTERNVGGQPEQESYPSHDVIGRTETLDDLNLSLMMSHRWQVISHCPEAGLREYLNQTRSDGGRISQKEVYGMGKSIMENPLTKPLPNNRVKTPPGETIEHVCRRGLALELEGNTTAEVVAKKIGIDTGTYRRARYIIWLTDRDDLSASDQEKVAEALAFMNEESVASAPYERVEAIINRVWGESQKRVGRRGDANRMKTFDHAYGTITQVCFCAADVDLPQLSADRTSEILSELTTAIKCLRTFRARIKEIHK